MERRTFLKTAGGALATGALAGCLGDYGEGTPIEKSGVFENITGSAEELTLKLEDDPTADSWRITDIFVVGEGGERVFHEPYNGIETIKVGVPGPGQYRCIGIHKDPEEGHVSGKDVVVVEVKEDQSVEAVGYESS